MNRAASVLLAMLACIAVPSHAEQYTNPVRSDPQAAKVGEALFNSMNCDGCHGGGATGFVGPSLVDGRWRFGGDDESIFRSIRDGRPHGMPAYGGMLPDSSIWQLITYLQAQTLHKDVPTIAWPQGTP